MSKVICVTPTRGLIYAKTVKGIKQEIDTKDWIIIDQKPMPDCFNIGVQEAIKAGADYIWFVEEDNEVVKGSLKALLDLNADIATVDYDVGNGVSHIHRLNGVISWCGLGCTLIKKEVFTALEFPWFRVDKLLRLNDMTWIDVPNDRISKSFGGHDVWFFLNAIKKGFKIEAITEIKARHFRAEGIIKKENNNGFYLINSL